MNALDELPVPVLQFEWKYTLPPIGGGGGGGPPGSLTFVGTVAVMVWKLAVMSVVPSARATTTPESDTDATAAFEEVQLDAKGPTGWPRALRPVAASLALSPTSKFRSSTAKEFSSITVIARVSVSPLTLITTDDSPHASAERVKAEAVTAARAVICLIRNSPLRTCRTV